MKIKTRSAAKKRYKITKNGVIMRRKAYRGHILEKKSPKQKRQLRTKTNVFKGETRAIKQMLVN